MYWPESLAEKVENAIHEDQIQEPVRFNAGLSVSGLQHVGRIRGELLVSSSIRKILEDKGYQTEQYLTLYTQDEWKGKDKQLAQFSQKEKAEKYKKWPLVNVPDPYSCHKGWVEHFWEPFGRYLGQFVKDVQTITTTQLYKEEMKPKVKMALEKKEEIREVLNKYREVKLPEDWILFNPICERCGKIGTAKGVKTFPKEYQAQYTCSCGKEGKLSIEQGKLAWRVEWAAIWSTLGVDFEPYGKDHAAPGGSRDTANEIIQKIYNRLPPLGTSYEWVAYREDDKENVMSSSDFKGFTPKDWIEIADPAILNYLYLLREPMKQITLDLRRIPQYTRRFRTAEKVFFGKKEEREEKVKEAYRFSFASSPPEDFPTRIPYSHAALFVQTIPENISFEEIQQRLHKQEIVESKLSERERELLKARLDRARTWVQKWAPERYLIGLIDVDKLSDLASSLPSLLRKRTEILEALLEKFKKIEWKSHEIKNAMSSVISPLDSDTTRKVFKGLYLAFLGKERGPRIARYFSLLEREIVLERLRRLQGMFKEG